MRCDFKYSLSVGVVGSSISWKAKEEKEGCYIHAGHNTSARRKALLFLKKEVKSLLAGLHATSSMKKYELRSVSCTLTLLAPFFVLDGAKKVPSR